MNTSVIRQRVADFLKQHAPFESLSDPDLLDLAGSGRVKFHESEEYVLRQGDGRKPFIWIIQQGRVELMEEAASGERLRDVLGEGDLLGLERFAGDGSCRYSARTASDVILYGISAPLFEALLTRYPAVQHFVSAHFSVAGILGFGSASWLDAEAPPADFLRSRLVALPLDVSTPTAALSMLAARNATAALVDPNGHPAGILTPMDLCAASNGHARSAARPCPPAIAAPVTTRAAVRAMLREGVEELAVTADGTPSSALQAILTGSELALFCGHNPVGLVRAIRDAASTSEIVPLLQRARKLLAGGLAHPRDVDDCAPISTELVAALADACIRLAAQNVVAAGIDPPGVASCWVMFGASARGDLLGLTQPRLAAVYDDSAANFGLQDSMYFTALAGEVAGWFHACGLAADDASWPQGSQPSMPLSEWKRFFSETIQDPIRSGLYARREFFDVWPLAGDRAILLELNEHIRREMADNELAVTLLANDTLAHLPLFTFYEGLVLDLDGEQRNSFDISTAAIWPIADAARVFALASRRFAPANTLARLEAAAADFPAGAAILRDAAEASRIALYYQTLAGGSRIEPSALGKFDQRLLKTAFSSIERLLEFTASTFEPQV